MSANSFKPALVKILRLQTSFIAVVLPSLLLGLAVTVPAQKPEPAPCKVGSNASPVGSWIWAPHSRVKVYLRTKDFKAEEIGPVLAPLQTWNAVLGLTGSGVILEYAGDTDEQMFCEKCLTIMRGSVTGKGRRHGIANLIGSATPDQIIVNAAIVIEPNLKNLKELTDVVAHELGHNFGLRDCYTCKKQSTVMNQFKGFDTPNDLPAPSRCDIAQVAAAYQQISQVLLNASLASKIPPVDEGEEPVEDDTPIVPKR